jgi:hypothetical protein
VKRLLGSETAEKTGSADFPEVLTKSSGGADYEGID